MPKCFRSCLVVLMGLSALVANQHVLATAHPSGVPDLSSRPAAPYTLYLNLAGFNFTGTWGSTGLSPGNTPALNNVLSTDTFSDSDQAKIKEIWARTAQAYTPFNINVTTIDPAVAAGQATTDGRRQAYYDSTPKLMHTVIGPQQNNWFGHYGGVSYLGVAQVLLSLAYNDGVGAGYHTNWVFTEGLANYAPKIAAAAIHEDGHGLSLYHQSDYSYDFLVNEYSRGDNANFNGSYSPIMGAAYYTQRGTWRLGDSNNYDFYNHTQNDPAVILSNFGIGGYVQDGIGHTLLTANPLPLNGPSVDFTAAHGVITPRSTTDPNPIGAYNYTEDWFSFQVDGVTPITLTCNNGTQFLTPGIADPGPTLRSTLSIFDSSGSPVAAASEDTSTLKEVFSGLLPLGTYYAQIASYGGHTQMLTSGGTTYDTSYYYDMGSYFLTGSYSVPEPGMLVLLLGTVLVWLRPNRRRVSKLTVANCGLPAGGV